MTDNRTAAAVLMDELFAAEEAMREAGESYRKAEIQANAAITRRGNEYDRRARAQRHALATFRALQTLAKRDNTVHNLDLMLRERRRQWRETTGSTESGLAMDTAMYDRLDADLNPRREGV